MPRSNFYWEMSVEAVKRKGKGESTYSTHSTVRQWGGGGAMKAQIPFSPLNSFIHLFVPSLPPPLSPILVSLPVSQCPEPPYIIVLSVIRQRFADSGANCFTSDRQYQLEISWPVAENTSTLVISKMTQNLAGNRTENRQAICIVTIYPLQAEWNHVFT